MKSALCLSAAALVAASMMVSATEVRKIFHVQGIRSAVEDLQLNYPEEMDIWQESSVMSNKDDRSQDLLDLTLYATDSFIDTVTETLSSRSNLFSAREEASIDIQQMIKDEAVEMDACRKQTAGFLDTVTSQSSMCDNAFFDCFRPFDEIFAFLDKMVEAFPKLISKFQVSKTVEGRVIYGYKISQNLESKKPAIFVQGMLHAREWLGPPTVIYSMASLIDGAMQQKENVLSMLKDYDFYYVPLVNIDGYKFSWESNRMWRKNRKPYKKPGKFLRNLQWWGPSVGVDLNRNYGPKKSFCAGGTSTSPGSDIYCGVAPFSEPEVAGIDKFLTEHPEIAGGIDVHTYGDLVLRPYGLSYDKVEEPHNSKMSAVGDRMANEINNFDSNNKGKYRSIRASELYKATGTFMDYLYESHNKMPSITFELRGGNFIVKKELIRVTGKEIFHGFEVFVEEVRGY